ncbi:MAG: DUF1552 domain-containing protein [Sandaracinaceae bacterium]
MKPFTRRTFLASLAAGAATAAIAPWRRASAAEGDPCRFLFVLEGNCYEPRTILAPSARAVLDDGAASGPIGDQRWWYRTYQHDSMLEVASPDLAMAPALGALADHGLVDQTTAIFGLSSRIIGGGHSGYHGALSCTRTLSGRAGGQTIDAYLAGLEAVRGETPFEAVRLNVGSGALNFGACAAAPGLSLPMINDPVAAHSVLYGAFAPGEAQRSFNRQRHLLAYLRDDVQGALLDGRLGGGEAAKLDLYGRSIEAMLLSQARIESMDLSPAPTPESGLSPLPRLGAQLDLATSALIDGLTPVAVVGSGAGGPFSLTYSSVSSVSRHDMHHGSAGDATLRQNIEDVTRLQVAEIARVAKRLADTPEGDGNMLDRTVIVFIGDNGEQHHSTASEFPVLLIGGGAFFMPGGRTLLYPGVSSDGNRQLSNLWNTLGYIAGESLDDFGGEAGNLRRAFGPLEELLAI